MRRNNWTALEYYQLDKAKTYLGFANDKVSGNVDRAVHNCLCRLTEEHARSRYSVSYQLKLAERALGVIAESRIARSTVAKSPELQDLLAVLQKQLSELVATKGGDK